MHIFMGEAARETGGKMMNSFSCNSLDNAIQKEDGMWRYLRQFLVISHSSGPARAERLNHRRGWQERRARGPCRAEQDDRFLRPRPEW